MRPTIITLLVTFCLVFGGRAFAQRPVITTEATFPMNIQLLEFRGNGQQLDVEKTSLYARLAIASTKDAAIQVKVATSATKGSQRKLIRANGLPAILLNGLGIRPSGEYEVAEVIFTFQPTRVRFYGRSQDVTVKWDKPYKLTAQVYKGVIIQLQGVDQNRSRLEQFLAQFASGTQIEQRYERTEDVVNLLQDRVYGWFLEDLTAKAREVFGDKRSTEFTTPNSASFLFQDRSDDGLQIALKATSTFSPKKGETIWFPILREGKPDQAIALKGKVIMVSADQVTIKLDTVMGEKDKADPTREVRTAN